MFKGEYKVITIALIIGLVYLGVFITFFGEDNNKKTSPKNPSVSTSKEDKGQELIMLLNPHIIIKYQNNKFSYISDDKEYNKYKFNLYDNNDLIGEYSANYSEKEIFLDENNNQYDINGNLFAITGNIDYTFNNIASLEIDFNDKNIIRELFKENNITTKGALHTFKYQTDIDNDNKLDTIYSVDNIGIENTYGESNSYAFVFVYKNNEFNYIYLNKDSIKANSNLCYPILKNNIDINNDNSNELFITCNYKEEKGSCLNIYSYNKKEFKKVLNCNL